MTRATFYRDNVSRFVIVAFSSPLPFPSRFHFGSSDHRGKSSYCSMEEPSLTFGTAPSSRRLLPKIQNYSALRGHYVMTSLLFCWGNNAPSGNYPKAPPSISPLFPIVRRRSTFRPERERRFNFSFSFVSQFSSEERKMERFFMN